MPSTAHPPAATPATQPQPSDHAHPLASKLKHMFENQKYAIFNTTIVIHEVGNVPQLQGNFAVGWKFRGKRPRGGDSLDVMDRKHGPRLKPSLPNLHTSNPSSSSISVRTSSTSSSLAVPPLPQPGSLLNPEGVRQKPNKSHSLPPGSLPLSRWQEKKGSDPTPLMQVLASNKESSFHVESPTPMIEEPDGYFEGRAESTHSGHKSGSSGEKPESQGSGESIHNGPRVNIHRASITSPSTPIVPNQDPRHQHLSVPFPRSSTSSPSSDKLPVPIRSGTTPSYLTLLDPAGLRGNRPSLSNAPSSIATHNTDSSSNSDWNSFSGTRPLPNRNRSVSGPNQGSSPERDTDSHSTHRKGETPIRPLKTHACAWDFELQHTLKMPLSKPEYDQHRRKPGGQNSLPILGGGPTSESGLELTILQYPAKSRPAVVGANPSQSATNLSGGAAKPVKKEVKVDKTPVKFGTVDIDLAPFAGKGRMTRRFLLKGSRTNATIKVTVEMQWIGGEVNWSTPPLEEGHHVTGVGDLMSGDHETIRGDLFLVNTRSSSSSESTNPLERTRTNLTTISDSSYWHDGRLTRTSTRHDSYERHVRDDSPSHSSTSSISPPRRTPGGHQRGRHLSPDGAGAGRAPSSRTVSPHKPDAQTSHLSIPHSATAPAPAPLLLSLQEIQGRPHRHHTHHLRHHRSVRHANMHDLPPETIIEAIFNPRPAAQAGPFTFVPEGAGRVPGEMEVMDGMVRDANGSVPMLANDGQGQGQGQGGGGEDKLKAMEDEGNEKGGMKKALGWGRMRGRARNEKIKNGKGPGVRVVTT